MEATATLGILVGGRATRMGGAAKGLLRAPGGETIVARTARLFAAVGARAVLLGRAEAYAETGLPALSDEPDVQGPLAGLLALLRRGATRRVYLVGCDMPFIGEALVARLAREAEGLGALAAHDGARFLPLFAALDRELACDRAEQAVRDGARSPSGLLRALDAARLTLTEREARELADWDTDEDVAGHRGAP